MYHYPTKMSDTCDKSKKTSSYQKLKSGIGGMLYIIVTAVLVEYVHIISKPAHDEEESIEHDEEESIEHDEEESIEHDEEESIEHDEEESIEHDEEESIEHDEEESIEHVDHNPKLTSVLLSLKSDKHDMIAASKLYFLMSDFLQSISINKGIKKILSQLHIQPDVALDVYPVYGPGVGPAIDLFLTAPRPPSRQEMMANESLRLCTFHNYPLFRTVSCVLMAKVGLYYNGNNDEVTCYSCQKSISGWNPATNPYRVHKEASPNCNHLRRLDIQTGSGTTVGVFQYSARAVSRSPGEIPNQAPAITSASAANKSGSRSDPGYHTASSAGSRSDPGYHTVGSRSDPDHDTASSAGNFVETAGCKFGGPNAKHHVEPQPSDNSMRSTGSADSNNYSSEASHHSNNSGDPQTSSGTNSIIVQDTTTHENNVPTQPTTVNTPVVGNNGMTETRITSRAFYPDYVLPADRLKTFDRWPRDIHQTPEQMLESGFFYAGYEDCVRCFQCGIGLRNWEPPDNPHVEHARWSPRCAFLLQVKGPDFINLVLDAVAQLERQNNNLEAPQSAEPPPLSSNNNTVTTTSQTLKQSSGQKSSSQQSSAQKSSSQQSSAQKSISPSATPSGTPSDRSSTLSTSRAAITGPNSSIATSLPLSAPASSQKIINGVKIDRKKNTEDSLSSDDDVTETNKTQGLSDLMEAKVVRKLIKDGYGEDNVRAAVRLLMDRKDEITEEKIRDIVQKNTTSVQNKKTGLKGGNAGILDPLNEELLRIKQENREMRERTVCKICLEDQVSVAFVPCGHLVACAVCAHELTKCAVCRKPITNKIHTDMSV
ncbi:death-associated inhibitor of apoptosis 1-like isoform X2 [Argopecten irradians]|uniref:death-associated inhibitor of apoptosis 1-like isoform X2 n=1 Tax=Argopecten irradians TaxID=31199 RepID=UPI003723706C